MSRLKFSAGLWAYDRTLPLIAGTIKIDNCDPTFEVLTPEQVYDRTFGKPELDVGEMSLSYQLAALARGDAQYIGIPVFPSRSFRHSTIYINTKSGIKKPEDLRGRRIGTQDYDMTAAVVVRGFLREEYGLDASDMRWVIGDAETRWRTRIDTRRPPGVDIAVTEDRLLDDMLVSGDLDAVIALRPMPSMQRGDDRVRRLFPDWRKAEQDYYTKTKFFPIMHLVGIRQTLVQENPWLPKAMYDAFCQAKDYAIAELEHPQVPKATLPWVMAEVASTRAIMGDNYWAYGVEPNRDALTRFAQYNLHEGLSDRLISIEELFPTTAGKS